MKEKMKNENNNNLLHGEVFCCKRLRLLEALLDAGFKPYATVPEPNNFTYNNWLFRNSPSLEKFLTNYFDEKRREKVNKM